MEDKVIFVYFQIIEIGLLFFSFICSFTLLFNWLIQYSLPSLIKILLVKMDKIIYWNILLPIKGNVLVSLNNCIFLTIHIHWIGS